MQRNNNRDEIFSVCCVHLSVVSFTSSLMRSRRGFIFLPTEPKWMGEKQQILRHIFLYGVYSYMLQATHGMVNPLSLLVCSATTRNDDDLRSSDTSIWLFYLLISNANVFQ